MSATTTETPTTLEGLLETELFGGLNNITEDDIARLKARITEDRGSPDKEPGQVIGRLTDYEIRFLALSYKLNQQVEEVRKEGITAVSKLRGLDPNELQEALDEQLKMAERFKQLKSREQLIDSIFRTLMGDRFHEKLEGMEACHLTLDANFDVRATGGGDDCENCPMRDLVHEGARVTVVGLGHHELGKASLLEILLGRARRD